VADSQVGDEIALIDVAGAVGLLRVVATDGTLLVAVEGLNGVVERALAQKFLPTSPGLQELEKENQLAFASDRSLIVPFCVKTSARGVKRLGSGGVS
jgi:hypothetical protein